MTVATDDPTVRAAIASALRAPSVHNTQPWRLLLDGDTVHLFADRGRLLHTADPDGRELVLSCGALLHHLCVLLSAHGWRPGCDRLPDPADPDHLAAIRLSVRQPSRDDIAAVEKVVDRRRTDRRRFTSWPVPAEFLDLMIAAAAEYGVFAVPLTDPGARTMLAMIIADATWRQDRDGDLAVEARVWSGRTEPATDGVLAASAPADARMHGDTAIRAFPGGRMVEPDLAGEPDGGELLVIATADDEPLSWLRSGEAAGAALLAATAVGLATCPLSQPLEAADTRRLVRDEVLGGLARPQLILRVGWAPTSAPPLPRSPRRLVDEVLG